MIPKEVDYARIGQRIRSLRQSKNMTQAELSALVDCSNNYLSHIETAQCKVSLSMLLKLSYALGESIEYFYSIRRMLALRRSSIGKYQKAGKMQSVYVECCL